MNEPSDHRAGFVNIAGKPNAGKSTLLNALVSYPLSIATHKPQTTRHTILGIDNGEHHQIIYVDMPGYLDPAYALQNSMMKQVNKALVESDIVLWLVDSREKEVDQFLLDHRKKQEGPFLLLLNKIDLLSEEELAQAVTFWQEKVEPSELIPIAALHQTNLEQLQSTIVNQLPCHPAYYEKDAITTSTERFLVAEIIRKAIILHYKQEIPYSTQVIVESFQEEESILRIAASIYVERKSQKAIIIGHQGEAIKRIGIEARQEIEKIFKKKVFLSQHVRIRPNWRKKPKQLTSWGY